MGVGPVPPPGGPPHRPRQAAAARATLPSRVGGREAGANGGARGAGGGVGAGGGHGGGGGNGRRDHRPVLRLERDRNVDDEREVVRDERGVFHFDAVLLNPVLGHLGVDGFEPWARKDIVDGERRIFAEA